MSKQNEPRNQAMVHLRRLNRKVYTVDKLKDIFEKDRALVHRVVIRDWDKYPLPDIDKQQNKPFDKS